MDFCDKEESTPVSAENEPSSKPKLWLNWQSRRFNLDLFKGYREEVWKVFKISLCGVSVSVPRPWVWTKISRLGNQSTCLYNQCSRGDCWVGWKVLLNFRDYRKVSRQIESQNHGWRRLTTFHEYPYSFKRELFDKWSESNMDSGNLGFSPESPSSEIVRQILGRRIRKR